MNLIQKARFQFSKLFKPSTDQALRNVFNEAFLWGLGGGYVKRLQKSESVEIKDTPQQLKVN